MIKQSLLIILFAFVTVGLNADSGPIRKDHIIVAVDDFPPWKIVNRNRVSGGIDIDFTQALLDKLQMKPIYKVYPWKRCLYKMEKGEADLISGITRSEKRERFLHFIEPPYKKFSNKVFYVRKGSGIKYRELSDFEGKLVGVELGVKYFPGFDTNRQIRKYEITDNLRAFRMLVAERLDAVIITEENGAYLMQRFRNRDQVEKTVFRFNNALNVYFAISKKSRLMSHTNALREGVIQLIREGRLESIKAKYLPEDQKQ